MASKVLVSGGAGYIGSTICSALEESGIQPIVLDSLITGKREFVSGRIFYEGDIGDGKIVRKILHENRIDYTIHCAALIVVPESVNNPYNYYKENVSKSNEFFYNLSEFGCKKIIFSSSASIYGKPNNFIVHEASPIAPESPYAKTKYMMELVLQDFCKAYQMQALSLRYFNPIGADPKMRSGIHVKNPSHVLGTLVDVALGKKTEFQITGTQWATRDGSGMRDFFHVWDLARAHVLAVQNFDSAIKFGKDNYLPVNLGTGTGVTVKELLRAFESVFGKKLNVQEAPPRLGDVAGCYADSARAMQLLQWKPEHTLEQGISDALKWGTLREKILGYK
jgi:UDP-glucose 4-epimerase